MSVAKRGARVGVAAFAVGLSLGAPHAAGTAAADAGASSASTPQQSTSDDGPTRARPQRSSSTRDSASGPRGGQGIPGASAATASSGADPDSTRPARRVPGWPPAGWSVDVRPNDPSPAAAQSPSAPRATVPATTAPAAGNSLAVRPDRTIAAAAAVAPAALTAVTAPRPAATLKSLFAGPPPAPAKPLAAIGAAVTGFFDAGAKWLSGLPGGQFSHLLEGALLLVRRTLFSVFPALDAGQTTGQATGDTYFTDAQLKTYLLDLAKQRYGSLFGTTVPVYANGYGPYGPYPDYLKTQTDQTDSDTNTQVDGVDEADFVENDGQYIYTAHNGQLTIVRGDDLSVASSSTLTGNVAGEYLSGDRLTVITQSGSGWYGPQVKMAYPGYWMPWNPQTTVTVYDVSDRTAPTVVSQTVFDGAYDSSRSVDGVVYVVMQKSVNVPTPHYTDTPITYVGGAGVGADSIRYDPNAPVAYRTYETWDEYVARVGDTIVADSLPHAYRVDADGNTVDLGVVAGAQDIVRPHAEGQQSLVTVVSVDSGHAAGAPAFTDSVGSMTAAGGTVYMTPDALYIAGAEDQNTRIQRFVVDGTDLSWQAAGVVPGTVINQFAMDESDGYLRVATHTNDGGTEDNGIYILDADTLAEVGRLTGLAPGEQLYAVRYVGDTAYLVTFVRTDPLFAVDLSDPTAPTLLGELEVPGFSNYLQPVGDGLLLGIGQERETGNWNAHVTATLFDVSDGAAMTQADREYLDPGYQWSWSDAQFDHHALLYSSEDGLLVVPVSGSGYDPETGYRSGQYLKVLRVGPAGIETIGEIHPAEPTLRTVRIGDVLYAVGDTTVTAYRVSDLGEIGTSTPATSVV